MTTKQEIKNAFAEIGINLTEQQYSDLPQALSNTLSAVGDYYEQEHSELHKSENINHAIITMKNLIQTATTYGADKVEMKL